MKTATKRIWIALGALAVLIVGGTTIAIHSATPRPIPDKTEALGPLELVTHTISYLSGWNEGHLGWRTTENYSIRYRGKPFTFEGRAGMFGDKTQTYSTFNAIVSLPTRRPAVVINVGDPNNTSFFYLVREGANAPRLDYLTDISGGEVSANMLDAPPADKQVVRDMAVHRSRLSGGRFLLLGGYFVLDTETFAPHKIEHDSDNHPDPFASPLAMSPDHQSFARFGFGKDNVPILLDTDFVQGRLYAIPIVRARMRYNGWEELTAGWLDHHCEWKPGQDGHQRLTERAHYTPLPYRGERPGHANDPAYHEYNLHRVQPVMFEKVNEFIEKEFHGTRRKTSSETSAEFEIDGAIVNVLLHDFQVGVYNNRGQNPEIVDRIGDRFDALLKTGSLNELFLPMNQ